MRDKLFEEIKDSCPEELFDDDPSREELELRAGKFATIMALHPSLQASDNLILRIAKGRHTGTFENRVMRAWREKFEDGGLTPGDIEIAAIEAGHGTYEVYETLWPFDPAEQARINASSERALSQNQTTHKE